MEETEIKDPLDAVRPFYIASKVASFAYAYEPCYDETEADEFFTDEKLRRYFNAYPRTTGDPLVLYIEDGLIPLGFRMTHCFLLGEPAILVRNKH